MSTMVRNVSVQPAQAQMPMPRPTQGTLFSPTPATTPLQRASELSASQMRSQRTSSPKAWTGSPMPASAPQRPASPDETFVGANAEKPLASKPAPGPGAVRSSSGSQHALSPSRSAQAGRGSPQKVEVECAAGLHFDCPTCMETQRRGFVLCRLPCGHTVRAQIVDTDLPASLWGGGSGPPGGARSESPPLLSAQQRDRDHTVTSPPPRSIMRQVSGSRNPVPSVGILAPLGNSLPHPPAPLSPPRGPASPSSPQQTPGTMYRKATSSLTSFNIPREGAGPPPNVDVAPAQQMTSRSSGGGGSSGAGLGGSSQGGAAGPPSREASTREKGPKRQERELVRTEPPPELRTEARRPTAEGPGSGPTSTVAEVVTDSRGDVLHRMCNVILLSPQTTDKEQQLKVRGQIIGTYWDERDIGPTLDHPGEVQVMVTYVEASERSAPLLFPTKYATTFGDTETAEGNIIKWKASLCKVGKKFS